VQHSQAIIWALMIKHHYQTAIPEAARMIWRSDPAIVKYAILFLCAEVTAILVEEIVLVSERPMREKLHPRFIPDSFGARSEGATRHEVNIPDPTREFLKHSLPGCNCLSSTANEIVYKDNGIVGAKSRSEEVAPANKQ